MKHQGSTPTARQVIRRISDLRDLGRRLAQAGYRAGLHSRNPQEPPAVGKVAEDKAKYLEA